MAVTTVQGIVTDVKTGDYGIGIKLTERIEVQDKVFDRNWMCWFKTNLEVRSGDALTVTGTLTVKLARDPQTKQLRTYTDKQTGQLTPYQDFQLNECKIADVW